MDRTGARASQRALVRLLLAVWVVAGLVSVGVALAHVSTPGDFPNDLLADYVSGKEVLAGGDPYRPLYELIVEHVPEEADHYPLTRSQRNAHTPLHIVLLTPLALLPYTAARALWVLLDAGAIVAAVMIVLGARGVAGRARRLAIATGVLALPLVAVDVRYGQVSGILLLLLVLGWRALERGRDAAVGVALGTAAVFRVFPGLLVIALIRMRRWRATAWTAAAAALASGLAVGVVGLASSITFAREGAGDNLGVWAHTPWNLSGSAILVRVLTPFDPSGERVLTAAARASVVIGGLIFLALIARVPGRLSGRTWWGAVPLVILASPLAWEHYMVLLLPATVFAATRRPLDAAAIAVFALVFLRAGQVGVWLDAIGIPVDYGAQQMIRFTVTITLLGAAAALEWRRRAPQPAPVAPRVLVPS